MDTKVMAAFRVFMVSAGILVGMTLCAAYAQTTNTSGLEGKISDKTGAVLPGVAVTISSPALQTPQLVTITDSEGQYRFTALPAGVYTATYELAGFQTLKREGIRLAVGFVATIDESIAVGSITESITVSGQSPTVDIRTTTTQTNLSKDFLAAVPTANSLLESVKLAEGVRMTGTSDVGGSGTGSNNQKFVAYGTSNGGIRPLLEGIDTHYSGNNAGYYDAGAMEEVQVKAMGGDAEATTPGVQIMAIVKSGGNEFHGREIAYFESPRLQASNIDDRLRSLGVNAPSLNGYYDIAGDLGGRIIRDRLWFYGSAHRQQMRRDVVGYVGNDRQRITQYNLKFTGQATTKQRLNFLYFWPEKQAPEYRSSAFIPFEATDGQSLIVPVWKSEWTYAATDHILMSVLGGSWISNTELKANGIGGRSVDTVTMQTRGGTFPNKTPKARHQFTASVTYFKTDFLGGDHDLKIGGELGDEYVGQNDPRRPAELGGGDYTLQFQNGAPFQVILMNLPVFARNHLGSGGLYIKDNWKLGDRLTFNLGFRFDHTRVWVPAQEKKAGAWPDLYPAAQFSELNVYTWNNPAPRIGIAYALTADGRTALKATWGRYNWVGRAEDAGTFNGNASATTTYRWNDPNGDRDFQRGEEGQFISATGASTAKLNPDLKQAKTHEATLALERELTQDVATRVTYVYRRETGIDQAINPLRPYEAYTIPITQTDPGPDGRLGTADDGGPITYFDYSPAYRGAAFTQSMRVNTPGYVNAYHNVEMGFTKRLSDRWQMNAHFLMTHKNEWISAAAISAAASRIGGSGTSGPAGVTATGVPQDPNAALFPKAQVWESSFKVSGSYELPYGLQAAAVLDHQSGEAYARSVRFTQGLVQLSSVTVGVEPVGAQHLPDQTLLTLRLEKKLALPRGHSLSARFDVFNALNTNAEIAISAQSGPTYGQILGIVPPRIAGFGVTYQF